MAKAVRASAKSLPSLSMSSAESCSCGTRKLVVTAQSRGLLRMYSRSKRLPTSDVSKSHLARPILALNKGRFHIHGRAAFVSRTAQTLHIPLLSRRTNKPFPNCPEGFRFPSSGPLHRSRNFRVPRLSISARWGRKQGPEHRPSNPAPVAPAPPDARNLGKLSKVLPFSVYELQRLEFARDLKEGDYGADVEALQRALHTFGHMPKDSQITGYFGKATFVAVREWQRAQGLPGTGYWGPMSQETFSEVVRRHALAQEALVTQASPTTSLANSVTATITAAVPVRLPQSSVARAGIGLGVLLVCTGAVAAVLRLRAGLKDEKSEESGLEDAQASPSGAEEVWRNGLSYQGRWGRPEPENRLPGGYYDNQELNQGFEQRWGTGSGASFRADAGLVESTGRDSDAESPSEGLLNQVGRALYDHFGRFESAWNGDGSAEIAGEGNERLEGGLAESGRSDREGAEVEEREGGGSHGVLDYGRTGKKISAEEENAQLQRSNEALLKELSAIGVQKQAALKELEEERRRSQQLESLLEHKVKAIDALQAELEKLQASKRSQLAASHRE